MSIVFIKEHNENIYGIEAAPQELSLNVQKVEDHEPKISKFTKSFNSVPKVPSKVQFKSSKPDPKHFLRKHTPPKSIPHSKYSRKRVLTKPPVPETLETIREQDEKLKFTPSNMIRRNIQYAVNLKAKSPERVVVIDQHGTRKKLSEALEVTYINKKEFAKLPEFVIREKMKNEQKKLKEKCMSESKQPKCRYIIRDSRKKLLKGLKANWEELQRQYKTLPILTDTIPKMNRKSQIEKDLRQLEKDIVFLERHAYIYVYDDDEIFEENILLNKN